MKKLWLGLGLLIGLFGIAFAQQGIQLIPGSTGPLLFDASGNAQFQGHILNIGGAPTLSSCGAAGAAVVGSDFGGTVTVGSTPSTSCVITFAKAWGAAPACVVSPASGILAAFSYTVSTTAITVTQTSTASNTIQYICSGKQ